ncbi:hypothetical protein EJB05_11533, partial [Eragrostis curvula]
MTSMPEKMFCGTGSFKDVDKEEKDAGAGGKPAAAAAVAKEKAKPKKSKGKDNPYASRGLDKFSTVLSELESRREKILRRVGPDVDADHLMVRFVQSEAKGWVPIVVKLPSEEEQQQAAADAKKKQSKPAKSTGTSRSNTPPPTAPASPKEEAAAKNVAAPATKAAALPAKKKKAAGGERWSWSWGRMVRPCHYWPLALVLLLLSLVVFGRVFAICCTSIWWYLLPILSGDEVLVGASRLPATKTRMSDKVAAVAPPPSHGKKRSSGASPEVISPRSHAKKG